jgi:hypothetical protein
MSDSTALAVDAIKTMHDIWKVDPDRVQWIGNPDAFVHEFYGFDWWPSNFKVEVRVHGPHPELDSPTFRLSVRTDYLCDVDVSTPEFRHYLSHTHNAWAPIFATCTHPTALSEVIEPHGSPSEFGLDFTSTDVWLCSTAYLQEWNKGWLPRFLAIAATMQIAESQFMAEQMTSRLGGKANRSQPVGRAPLTSLPNLLKIEKFEIRPRGELPSEWIGTGEFEKIVEIFGRFNPGLGEASDRGVRIMVPFGKKTARINLQTDIPHLHFGNGLHVFLTLPYSSDFDSLSTLANEMNYTEDRTWCRHGMPFMGSWIPVQKHDETQYELAFCLFIPNLFYQLNLAEIFVSFAIRRARWAREFLLPNSIDLPLREILEAQKSKPTRSANAETVERLPQKVVNSADKSRQTSAWRAILVAGLLAGVLLLLAFYLSNRS